MGFLPFTISGIIAQNQTTKPRVLPNFTPKVPQEVVSLAVQRVSQKKAACFVDGTIEKKNYKIVDYTTSVSVNLEYNILFRLVNPCNDKIENYGFNIQKHKMENTFVQKIHFMNLVIDSYKIVYSCMS